MTGQLTFDLPFEPAHGWGDYFVSSSNAAAVKAVLKRSDWPQGKLVLTGPRRSGKTHLAKVWATQTSAPLVSAWDIDSRCIDRLTEGPVAVDNADAALGDRNAEEALFHLHNLALAQGIQLLITTGAPPANWCGILPDLQSRMQGAQMVSLSEPDDPLLAAVLIKQFADRQVAVDSGVILYLVERIERSFAGASRVVEALDDAALSRKRRITKAFARQILDKLAWDER